MTHAYPVPAPRRAVARALSCGLAFACLSALSPAEAATLTDARITEFLADNGDGIEDENGDRSDWIEIWNPTSLAGDLGGWYLTDDPANLTKWRFPAVELASGGYLVVFASGKDRAPVDGQLHTNFRLQSESGGYLALVKPDGVTIAAEFADYPGQFGDITYGYGLGSPAPSTLVSAGDTARWHVPSGPVAGWTDTGFDDSSWSVGSTGIGFDAVDTYLQYLGEGGDVSAEMRGINATVYIRIPFEVSNPAAISDLKLRMMWEDGFVAHLNGTEVHRERAPANPAWNSASDPTSGRNEDDAQTFFDYPLTQGALVSGTNILAIQGLNQSISSSDLLFVPELVGTFQDPTSLTAGFFIEPTPGEKNGTSVAGIVRDTNFSVDRGFHTTPFQVEITTATEGAQIRYTTDGTRPSESTGTVYTGPITIDTTTVLRAIAHKPGFRPTNIDTHTYIFPEDVVRQPNMSTTITQSPVYGPQMIDALESIPSISLAVENPASLNTEVERPISVEMIFPDGSPGFQENAGTTRFGNYVTTFSKKNFRLYFREEYGVKKLRFPVFDGFDYGNMPPVEEFDSLNLRTGSHDMIDRGAYLSNRFTDDSMLEMGHIAPHGRFVHVYVNGEYNGQYHLRERWNAAMAASYLGGSKEDYEAINANNTGDEFLTGDVFDGTGQYWRETQQRLNGPQPFVNAGSHIDIPDVVDFMLLWTSGNSESEFRSVGAVPLGIPFKFFMKDADGFLRPPGHPVTHNGPLNAMTRLRNERNPDYIVLLADRIHRHFFNDGAMTGDRLVARLQRRVDEVRLSILAELARWPQVRPGTNNHSPASWQNYQNNLLNSQLPNLTANMINRFRTAGMYPDVIAPVFSQHGGSVPSGGGITMSTNATAIYYTFDGSDPRLSGGAVNPGAVPAAFENDIPTPQDFVVSGATWKFLDDGSNQGTAWRTPGFDDSAWNAGPSELGYGEGDEATEVGWVDTDPVTGGPQRNATTYFRHKVTLSKPGAYSYFLVRIKYDDGAAVYVNGAEVARTANLPANAAYDTFATASTPSESTFFDYTVPSSHFIDGENTIAVELHQASAGSSDTSFDLVLRGEVDTTNGSNVTEPIMIPGPGQLKARAYNVSTGEWSALNEAFFSVDSIPADATNLQVAEVHYHPAEPSTPEEIAVSVDRDDYEFIEFVNTASQPIELAGLAFADAVTFRFPDTAILDPGVRAVIVRNRAAFTARYGELQQGFILGEYSGRLSNDGERIAIVSGSLGTLVDFTYNDQAPWPTLADGAGYSLVFDAAGGATDPALPGSWRSHGTVGGAPGAPDSTLNTPYLAWKDANNIVNDEGDADGDGSANFIEYASGTPPRVPGRPVLPVVGTVSEGGQDYLTMTFQRSLLATDVGFTVQFSTDLGDWSDAGFALVSETPNPGGETATVVWRSTTPVPADPSGFLRLLVRLSP